MEKGNRNRKIFIVVLILFVALFVFISYDMSQRTTAPWNKKKQLNRALPAALPAALPGALPAANSAADSLNLDSLMKEIE
ncbi:hypothetical protein CLV98_102163 [Dyadobacter jejuensis]|uniref:Uncharacterized protein n=1 Tax=Dyadobacter jejuensis TaxID=1082580 RepID=A0A316AR82_9BACT|nr:hypothetical protein [Dyadobacter jejuensis]PWJ59330.1 hypothetical protein CLV98_102163 [Dyadobacter jejuensis]